MILQQIIENLKGELARAQLKHGKWSTMPTVRQTGAILEEFDEWYLAHLRGDINGDHGEIAEALHVMTVMARRIMFLTGEDQ